MGEVYDLEFDPVDLYVHTMLGTSTYDPSNTFHAEEVANLVSQGVADVTREATVQTLDDQPVILDLIPHLAADTGVTQTTRVWGVHVATGVLYTAVIETSFSVDNSGLITGAGAVFNVDYVSEYRSPGAELWVVQLVPVGANSQIVVVGDAALAVDWRSQVEMSDTP